MIKYRFVTITEADSIKELKAVDFDDIEKLIKKSLPKGMRFIEFQHEKISGGSQSTMVEPIDSISAMVAKLKTK
jgi:hypothetical protein